MDPRPYHYQYRRPRLTNPTYQSLNLYQSLYHQGVKNRYQITNNNNYSNINQSNQNVSHLNRPQIHIRNRQYAEKYASFFKQKKQQLNNQLSNSVMIDSINPEFIRPTSNRSNQSNDFNVKQQKPSILISSGRNSMLQNHSYNPQKISQSKIRSNSGAYDRLNQFSIFQRQQKPYCIVGNYPRSTSTQLKKYPRLTLQDKLIQEGRYLPPV